MAGRPQKSIEKMGSLYLRLNEDDKALISALEEMYPDIETRSDLMRFALQYIREHKPNLVVQRVFEPKHQYAPAGY